MLFNSIDFALFLPCAFILYWLAFNKNIRLQNLFIIAASYIFYSWWDWRFLILISFTSLCSWLSGIFMQTVREKDYTHKKRYLRIILASNIVLNVLILAFFKYFNFFIETFIDAFSLFGKTFNIHTLHIILPVGISFYTFQALSYTIDVYRKHVEPTKDIISFFAFVSFFPQLVAGPIERATHFLPQFYNKRFFDYTKSVDGLRQILWGLFKKIAIADNCALVVNDIFANYTTVNGSELLIGAIFFTFQIYGDFSGYSDIATGTARLFGFNLTKNFNYPYFSRDIAEFWRRWHISLTTWFRDYIYIPLGGSKVKKSKVIRNTFVIFLISGFWHGANWTFILWGIYHALLFLPLVLFGKNRKYINPIAEKKNFPSLKETAQMGSTFLLVCIGWVVFRADNIGIAIDYLQGMIHLETLYAFYKILFYKKIVLCLIVMMLIEWFGRKDQFALEKLGLTWKRPVRLSLYYIITILVFIFASDEQQFIYFQF